MYGNQAAGRYAYLNREDNQYGVENVVFACSEVSDCYKKSGGFTLKFGGETMQVPYTAAWNVMNGGQQDSASPDAFMIYSGNPKDIVVNFGTDTPDAIYKVNA
jgi:hypothetical protein